MIEGDIAGRELLYDSGRTGRIYLMAPRGASWACRCTGCRNFESVRPGGFNREFRLLLDALGIDPRKETYLRHIVPVSDGVSLYAGTFGFIGDISRVPMDMVTPPGSDIFEPVGDGAWVSIREWIDPPGVWYDKPSLRLEFLILIDWVIDEPPPPMTDIACRV